ncbi:hypothetical protein DFO68_10239 [Halomonas ventosae]|uniref:Uncharacterized protein n=1 Tax=Halomonas ventosae TaxID=229007 RepID=A0A4R6I2L0_9GAMM|nr:hypothetical protein DFO68_10239 [Halomonas ventosae]
MLSAKVQLILVAERQSVGEGDLPCGRHAETCSTTKGERHA